MLGETCPHKNKKFPGNYLLRKGNINKLSVNVRNCTLSFEMWLGEKLTYFKI